MYYITVKAPPKYHQMTLEELIFGTYHPVVIQNETNTVTYEVEQFSERFLAGFSAAILLKKLTDFNAATEYLREQDRVTLYDVFYQEKHSKGGFNGFVNGIFKKQGRYVPCNYGAVCGSLRAALHPLISQHPAERHEEIYQIVMDRILKNIGDAGMVISMPDLEALFSSTFRRIDAPKDDLQNALERLRLMFENDFHAQRADTTIQTTYYHTAAFAYVKKRSTTDVLKRHQANESKWFAKLDFSNFFGTTTINHTMNMLSMIFPFSEICRLPNGRNELYKAVELGFLNGVLPQGTKLSPTLTNIIMVPIDFKLSREFRSGKQKFVYTRYADDMMVSSRYGFNVHHIEDIVLKVLQEFNAPYKLNRDKTTYGSIAGSNWHLGLMLNKENNITVGWENKKKFQAALSTYAMNRKRGIMTDPGELMHIEGIYNYYRSIEGETIDKIVQHLNQKFELDIIKAIKQDLRPAG